MSLMHFLRKKLAFKNTIILVWCVKTQKLFCKMFGAVTELLECGEHIFEKLSKKKLKNRSKLHYFG
jgi:hypothetical protein